MLINQLMQLQLQLIKKLLKKFPWAWGEVYLLSQKGPLAHISSTSNNLMAKNC